MYPLNADLLISRMERALPSSMAGKWVVIQVNGGHECRVADALCALEIQNYLPLRLLKRRDACGKPRWRMRPHFAGYVFVCCRDYDEEHRARRHQYVWGSLVVCDQKGLISGLDRIFEKIAAGELQDDTEANLIGRTCEVVAGPWRGHLAKVKSVAKKGLVNADIETLGRICSAEISSEYLATG